MPSKRQHGILALMVAVLVLVILASTLAIASIVDQESNASTFVNRSFTDRDANNHVVSAYSDLISRKTTKAADLPDPGPVNASNLRRGPGGPWTDGPYAYFCGIFNTGIPATIRSGSLSLRVVNVTYTTPSRSCLRVYCYDTSAIYICNDHPTASLTVPGYDIGWMADRLAMLCCDSHHSTSAQLFHPTEQWNTVVGYGNCRHDQDEPPSAFGQGNGGVNGDCIPNESRPSPGGLS